MAKNLRQLAADPTYMTPLDVRRELIKATDEYNDYMTRSINGNSGIDLHWQWEEAIRNLMKEADLKIREEGLRDLANGPRFKKHRETMTRLLTVKRYWDRVSDRMGVSNAQYQLDAGVEPEWHRAMSDPHREDPGRIRKPAQNIFDMSSRVVRGGNELYKGLVR